MQGFPISDLIYQTCLYFNFLLAPVLPKLNNIAIEQATFPTIFKTAEVVWSAVGLSSTEKSTTIPYEYHFGFIENLSTELLAINHRCFLLQSKQRAWWR